MIRPRNETEDLLLSVTRNCETFIKQTHTKPQESLEFKLTQSSKTFSSKPPIPIEQCWMLGVTSLEVYNYTFNIAEENNKIELYTDTSDEFPFIELKDEHEQIRSISETTPKHLQHEILGPGIIKAHKKVRSEKSSTDGYLILLTGYARSLF